MGIFGSGANSRRIAGIIGDGLLGLAGQRGQYAPMEAERQKDLAADALRLQQANRPIVRDTGNGGYVVLDPQTGAVIHQEAGAPKKTSLQENYEYLKTTNPSLADSYLRNQADPLMGVQVTGPNGVPGVQFYPRSGAGLQSAPAAVAPSMTPNASHIAFLKAHPDQAGAFDAKFGAGASASVLGGATVAPSPTFR
jgi:hypothetical protein